jgi:hypothetical protein
MARGAPALLALAHLTAGLALLTFGVRADGYPLHPNGLFLYLATVGVAAVALFVLARRMSQPAPDALRLLLISMPALASLALIGAIWLSSRRGGAAYPPYDLQDSATILFFSGLPALIFSAAAACYGSGCYLIVTGSVHLVVYFGTHALPHWWRYPMASLLGSQPHVTAGIVAVYGVGLALAVLRQRRLRSHWPGLWLASLLTTVTGAFILIQLMSALPGNGAYLGYEQTGLYVPANAWDASRPAAEFLATLAMLAAVVTDPLPLVARIGAGRSRAMQPSG